MTQERIPVSTMFSRAIRLKCPRCGSGGILRHWLKMKDRCPGCGLALERGEDHDFWLGAYAINLVIAEAICVIIAFIVLWRTWPAWRAAQWTAAVLALAMPFIFFPFSR